MDYFKGFIEGIKNFNFAVFKDILSVKGSYDYILLFLCLFVILFGSFIMVYINNDIKNQYKKLKKPKSSPPSSLLSIAWTILYILMGISLYRLILTGGDIKYPLILFTASLLLNYILPVILFTFKRRGLSFIITIVLEIIIIITAHYFYRINTLAGLLFIPYILWEFYSILLSFSIYKLNKIIK